MRIIRSENDKNLSKQKFKPYFCPNCRVLFDDTFNTFIINDMKLSKGYEFCCSECEEHFSEITYEQKKMRKSVYKISEFATNPLDVSYIVKSKIMQLHKEGFSQREIIRLTKFPKSKIEEYTKLPNKPIKRIDIATFKKKYLKITEEMSLDEKIECAIDFGCTVEQMRKLFHVANDRISKLRKNQRNSILRKNKIIIKDENVKIFKLVE